VERSLKEAVSELEARLERASERRFPVMGLKGAANALMIRKIALTLNRPLVVIAPLAAQAEALAGELAFFLDQPSDADAATCRLHLLPTWELRPFAQVSPPSDLQAAQLAALYALNARPHPRS
jgi:transcription-repair coupling factor (superfamily II helicase)